MGYAITVCWPAKGPRTGVGRGEKAMTDGLISCRGYTDYFSSHFVPLLNFNFQLNPDDPPEAVQFSLLSFQDCSGIIVYTFSKRCLIRLSR